MLETVVRPTTRMITLLSALLLLSVPLAGCLMEGDNEDAAHSGTQGSDLAEPGSSDGDSLSYAAATGHLTVYVKDSPTDYFSEIWVTIESVEVHLAPGSTIPAGDSNTEPSAPEGDETTNGNETQTADPNGNETAADNGNETAADNGNETAESNGNETAGNNGNETADPNGNETADPNGNETADPNGNEAAESNGDETVGNNGNETADPNGNETAGNNGNETAASGSGPSEGGWIVVVDTTRSLDLMAFSEAESKAFLGDTELTAGRYTQVRVHLSEAWGIRASDGEREDIELANPTVRFVRSFQVSPGATTQIVIDVDLDRSVKSYGPPHAPHGWRMIPVIGHVAVAEGFGDDPKQDIPDGDA
jgi:hypothetical protein